MSFFSHILSTLLSSETQVFGMIFAGGGGTPGYNFKEHFKFHRAVTLCNVTAFFVG